MTLHMTLHTTRSRISTILVLLTVSAPPLCAQGGAVGTVHAGIMGGATIPTHYLADYHGDDAHAHANAGAFFAIALPRTPFSVRLDGQWQQLPSGGDASQATNYRIIDGTVDLVYTLDAGTRRSFYLIGGGGVYAERVRNEYFDYTASATHYGFNGGIGVNFRLGRFSTFAESRYHYVVRGSRIGAPFCAVPTDLLAHTCPSDTRPSLQFVPVNVGFAF